MANKPFAHELKKFDSTTIAATRAAWVKELAAHKTEVLAAPYQRILDWAAGHIDYAGNGKETFAYGIFAGEAHSADAIVELVYTKSGRKWLKLLDLNLCPSVDLSFTDQNVDIQQLSSIFAAGVTGTVQLTSTAHPAKVTKLYGRSGTLLAFLKGVGTYIEGNSNVPGLKVSMEGRWLVFQVK